MQLPTLLEGLLFGPEPNKDWDSEIGQSRQNSLPGASKFRLGLLSLY